MKAATPLSLHCLIALSLLFMASCSESAEKSTTTPPAPAKPANWRNDGSGKWIGVTPPTDWSDKKNILWRTDIGHTSYSSLIKSGKKIFVATEEAELLCLDADSGKIIWRNKVEKKSLPEGQQEKVAEGHLESGNAPHTPVSDGKHVYVSFANTIVACFDLNGKRKWAIALGPEAGGDGRSSSPVIAEGKLLWLCGHLFAIDCATGTIAWENKKAGETYGTPIVLTMGKKKVVVTACGHTVRVADGKLLASDMGELQFASPIAEDGMVYWIGAEVYAYKFPTDKAEPFELEETYVESLDGEFYASPIIHKKIIYTVSNNAILYALDATKGTLIYEKPLPIAPNKNAAGEVYLYASLSLANDLIYISNTDGETVIFRPGRKYEEVAVNFLPEGTGATPIFSGKRIYTRDDKDVVCIGE